MRILFFSYAYPNPLQPGQGTFNRSMIAGLAHDHEVRVVSPVAFPVVWKAKLQGKPTRFNDSSYSVVPCVKAEYSVFYYPPKVLRSQFGQFLWWSVGRQFERTMKEFQPDVVLSYWAHPDGEVAGQMARRHGVPFVAMVGGSDVLLLGRTGSRRKVILNVLSKADAVVTVSEHISETLVSDGIPRERLHVVRRGVDRAIFAPGEKDISRRALDLPEDQSLLIAVGRLVPVKGFQHLIDACALLHSRGRSFRCCVLGDGPLRGELQAQIDRLGLNGIVKLRGPQPQTRLVEWYRAADLTVLSSLSEGVPNVLMESIACGTPFVATDVGGVSEIADHRHDRLVPAEQPEALANAIADLLDRRKQSAFVRCFEPLGLLPAARRLEQVLESVIPAGKAVSDRSENTGPVKPALGRSAEFCLTGAAASPGTTSKTTNAEEHGSSGDDDSRPDDELARTAEQFSLPVK